MTSVDPSSFGAKTLAVDVCRRYPGSIKDRVILITGPTVTSIGYGTAEAVAQLDPKLLILAGRDMTKLEQARHKLQSKVKDAPVKLLKLCLTDSAQIKEAVEELRSWQTPIDVVINNAAVMDTPYELTPEGHELQFATNYLGPWLFTQSIIPLVLESKGKRVVMVSSVGHHNGDIRWDDPAYTKGYDRKHAYGQGKTADILYAKELAKRFRGQGLTAFSLDPGGISTPLQKHWSLEEKQEVGRKYGAFHQDGTVNHEADVWKTIDQGASTTCRAAFDPDIASESGSFLVDCQIRNDKRASYAGDDAAAERLWKWTNELMGESF
ncbi:hypothetical protein BD324DRAFT_629581 [Kockovaella imperatae]|uniref:Short-chain dehydrogenase n=1 Tax=Kockovaella imperatae TaxID=4999 RepID=A0A1Y1UEJ8_9TREE|nr:hypothetical protein BD324DRAFT_629581 [Kockovaella imperatae]ORX35934.1 hypothetical protein BD324DRAFT_629581 [Kockovaella imperatae]